MANIYVNLHPDYTYSNVIIGDGYISELREYVSLVDWLQWDWHSVKGKRVIQVFGGFANDESAVEKHLERTWVLLQRIINSGEHGIFIRNSRNDEWMVYEHKHEYTEQQMNGIEVQRIREPDKERWIKSDIAKCQELLEYRQDEMIKEMLDNKVAELKEMEAEELLRQKRITEVWHDVN